MKRLIYFTSRFPYPLDKGDKLRAYHQIVGLAPYYEVHLIAISHDPIPGAHLTELKKHCASVNIIRFSLIRSIVSGLANLLFSLPFQVAYFTDRLAKKQFIELAKEISPDHVHCHLIRTMEYVRGLSCKVTLDYMDAFAFGLKKRLNSEKNWFKRKFFSIESNRLLRYESECSKLADAYCAISQADCSAIGSGTLPMTIVPNGVDLQTFAPRETPKKYDLVFMGNMTYPPNIAAVEFLLNEILPAIRLLRPRTTLLIAGIGSENQFSSKSTIDIAVQDSFRHISDSIACSRIMIAPMIMSIGLQNKILQAMAMKVPCITSESSNLAIGAKPDLEVKTCSSAVEYAEAVVQLLENMKLYELISLSGYRFVTREFSWEMQNQKLIKLIQEA